MIGKSEIPARASLKDIWQPYPNLFIWLLVARDQEDRGYIIDYRRDYGDEKADVP
jgi:hypothetical protein